MIQLICDCGGTKSSWTLVDNNNKRFNFTLPGMNPAVNTQDTLHSVLQLLPDKIYSQGILSDGALIDNVWFYGAGCIHGTNTLMSKAIEAVLPNSCVTVESDMLGAARALCGRNEGIACILGTGANSCFYDGFSIKQNTPSLGYILGDEGGGAVLGRILVNRLYKGLFPSELKEMFETEMHTNLNTIIENVYRKPGANRYLASFTYFISAHKNYECIHYMLEHCFEQFFRRNIAPYNRSDLKVNFVGSLAFHFETEVREAASATGFQIGTIMQQPINALVDFHTNTKHFN